MAKLIREAVSPLPIAILPDRTLIAYWAVYSLETRNQFWVACEPGEIDRFLSWAERKKSVGRMIEQARCEELIHAEKRAAERRARPSPHFVLGWESPHASDRTAHASGARLTEARKVPLEKLMKVHELIDSVNRWCAENFIVPSTPGTKAVVDENMVRYCCEYSLLDRPGCPDDGRRKGFSQKHASQLRSIRLLQARSLSLTTINSILHGRTLPQLRQLEHEELCLLRGVAHGGAGAVTRRSGPPAWA